jgi:phage terminase large subunit-like protein
LIPKAITAINDTLNDINRSINKEDIEHAYKIIEIEKKIDGQFEVHSFISPVNMLLIDIRR